MVLALEIAKVAAALPDELQQPAPRAVILLVDLDVLDELVDAGCDQRDLHLGRPRVALMGRGTLDDLDLFLFGQRHLGAGLLSRGRPWLPGGTRRIRPGSIGPTGSAGLASLSHAHVCSVVPSLTAPL